MPPASSAVADKTVRGARPLVVKVGGSLAETGRLQAALDLLGAARIPVVVVPGGGPFADSVRSLHATYGFNNATAHRLAMLGMHQMAEMMLPLHKRLELAESFEDISDALLRGRIPVWAPLRMIRDDKTIPADWTATSDSLAARLAELLGSAPLVLLKSVDVEAGASAADLARRGIVDPLYPEIVVRAGLSWRIFGPAGDKEFAAALAAEGAA
jgi:aspartokinase-like uncharacterized kinase